MGCRGMRRRGVVFAIAALVATLVMAAPAVATLTVSSTASALSIQDKSGTFNDDVRFALALGLNGPEWRVSKSSVCGLACLDLVRFEIGAGCRATSDGVACERAGNQQRVKVFLAGGDDTFAVEASSLPIIEPIEVNGQTGNDSLSGAGGADTLQGGSGNDTLAGGQGDDALDGSAGDDVVLGGLGDDSLLAGPGEDFVAGDQGDDSLLGGPDDDSLHGSSGNDTLGGSVGNDLIVAGPGADTITGGDGNDSVVPDLGADTVDAGAGDDAIFLGTASDERDIIQGGLGSDQTSYGSTSIFDLDAPREFRQVRLTGRSTAVRIVEANLETLAGDTDFSEGDVLRSIERYTGGLGADILTGVLSSNPGNYSGDLGDDTIFGSSGNNTITGGRGNDQLSSKAGSDIIDAKSGEIAIDAHTDPAIDCGTGTDLALLDLLDDLTPTACENIDRSPLGEGPHVHPAIPRLARVANGAVGVKLTCPRALRRACAGTLSLNLASASTARTSYSIRPGRSRRVIVRLGALARQVRSRTGARLISIEAGLHGRKTTERRITLRT